MRKYLPLLSAVSFVLLNSSPGGEGWVNGQRAKYVLGQPDFDSADGGTSASLMRAPQGVAVDPTNGKVFVADSSNNRVLRFASIDSLTNGASAEGVLGQVDFESFLPDVGGNRFFLPRALAFSPDGTLWVVDGLNDRVLRFDDASNKADGANADGVLGALDFDDTETDTTQSEMDNPHDVVVDASGNLFVADLGNNRVLMFADAANLLNGADAALVLGQPDFTSNSPSSAQNGLNSPQGLAISDAGMLFVSCRFGNRVVRFDTTAMLTNGANAVGILGQPDYGTLTSGTSNAKFFSPWGITMDPNGALFVVGNVNHRILRFPGAETLPDGAPADLVLGQDDFGLNGNGTSSSQFDSPVGLASDDEGRILVADTENDRVLIFDVALFQPDASIGKSASRQKGRNRYNRSGSGQKAVVKTKGKEVKFIADVQNDGSDDDTFTVRSRKTNRSSRIKVFSITGGKRNVTAAAKTGRAATGEVAPAGIHRFQLKVKPKGKAKKKRSNHKAWFQAASAFDGETDRVIGLVKNRP